MSGAVAETSTGPGVRDQTVWHSLTLDEACARLGVDPKHGLDITEVERRRVEFGSNKLAEAEKVADFSTLDFAL